MKRYKLNMTFDVTISDLTPESHATYIKKFHNAEELLNDPLYLEQRERQRRLLRALCNDEPAVRQYVTLALAEMLHDLSGENTLPKMLNVPEGDEYDVLLKVALSLPASDADYFRGADEDEAFSESVDELPDALSVELTAATLEVETQVAPGPVDHFWQGLRATFGGERD